MSKILNISIELERKNIVKIIDDSYNNNNRGYINTINANILVTAFKNYEYKQILRKSNLNICDGSVLASTLNIINKTQYSSYPGPDFFIDKIKEKKYNHTFLGSTKEVLNNLKIQLTKIDPNIQNAQFIELPFLKVNEFDYNVIGDMINQTSSDFIWVSLGAPKQEEFSSVLVKHINRGLIVSVGAAFDFYSGLSHMNRCPKILRNLKLEWLYRVFKQPTKTLKRLKAELIYMPIIILREILKK